MKKNLIILFLNLFATIASSQIEADSSTSLFLHQLQQKITRHSNIIFSGKQYSLLTHPSVPTDVVTFRYYKSGNNKHRFEIRDSVTTNLMALIIINQNNYYKWLNDKYSKGLVFKNKFIDENNTQFQKKSIAEINLAEVLQEGGGVFSNVLFNMFAPNFNYNKYFSSAKIIKEEKYKNIPCKVIELESCHKQIRYRCRISLADTLPIIIERIMYFNDFVFHDVDEWQLQTNSINISDSLFRFTDDKSRILFYTNNQNQKVVEYPEINLRKQIFEIMSRQNIDTIKLVNKKILLNFWFVNCPSCIKELKWFAENHVKFQNHHCEIIALNPYDTEQYISQFLQRKPMPFLFLHNQEGQLLELLIYLQNAFYYKSLPMNVLLDEKGNINKVWVGLNENIPY